MRPLKSASRWHCRREWVWPFSRASLHSQRRQPKRPPPAVSNAAGLAVLPRAVHTFRQLRPGSRCLSNGGAARILSAMIAKADIVWTSSDPQVAIVKDGVATPVGNGTATLTAKTGSKTAAAQVTVVDHEHARAVSFRNQVESILTKSGCNSGRVPRRGGRQERFQIVAARLRPGGRLFHDHPASPRPADRAQRSGPQPGAVEADRGAAAQRRRAVRGRFARLPADARLAGRRHAAAKVRRSAVGSPGNSARGA